MGISTAISHKELLRADKDYQMAALAVHLVYVSDRQPGIVRVKKGKGYCYLFRGKPIREKEQLLRIRRLVIPPSWTDVWICPSEKGHIQATGLDLRRRKQYRYHSLWNSLRNETKFHRLYEFAKALPSLRGRVEHDLHGSGLTQDKVLAVVTRLMEKTYIRVGNNEYERLNGSYGLTTLKDKHVAISGDKLVFSFTGKKGVQQNITLHNKRLARIVSQCRDIPGKELFQYYAADGTRHSVDSGMVNQYIKDATGMDFTAKDFRTWAGSLHALHAFREIGEASSQTDCKKKLAVMLDTVSTRLGNSRTICRKYYIHPGLIQLYEENKLVKNYLGGTEPLEEVLMKILRHYIATPLS